MTTHVTHHPAHCLGKKACGACIPECPFKAIISCGDIAFTIETEKCKGPCYEQYGKNNKVRPCQVACSKALSKAGKTSGLALPTHVS